MSEFILELGVVEGEDQSAFVSAIDRFTRWREDTCGQGWMDRDAPDLMIKTICSPDGRLSKAITFQDKSWMTMFMEFWQLERSEHA